jgi:hypothetical protein
MTVLLVQWCSGAVALGVLWVAQSIALMYVGEPLAWPLRYSTKNPVVRWTCRVMVQISWLIFLFCTFGMLGIGYRKAFDQAFPLPVPWRSVTLTSGIFIVLCSGMFAVSFALGWVQIAPRFDPVTRRAKTLRRFLTPLPLATVEESVFRGAVLGTLLRTLPPATGYTVLAVVYSSILFAAAHFIKRPSPGNPVWQQAYGFFLAGSLFGLAYVIGGRALWLPIGLHATAILTVELNRLYLAFNAPRWLAGYSDSPQSGLLGTVALTAAALAMVLLIR